MRATVLTAAAAAAAALAVSLMALLGAASWRDEAYQREVVPARRAAAGAIHEGRLPLWWDGAGFGAPLSRAPRSAALYPASWISTSGWGVDVTGVLHLVLLGAATSALAAALQRRRTGGELTGRARVLAAALPAVSGVGSAALVGGWIASLAWLVIALAILARWGEAERRAGGLAAALAMAAVGGGPELMLVAGLALAAQLATQKAQRGGLLLALVFATAASAAHWLPWMIEGAPGISAAPLVGAAAIAAIAIAALLSARWLEKAPVAVTAFAAATAMALLLPQRPARDRAQLDALPSWLAAPLPASLAAARDRGAPLRVFCPPRTAARDLAAGEPGASLFTATASLQCAQRSASAAGRAGETTGELPNERSHEATGEAPNKSTHEATSDALWRRGAGAGGRLLRRLSIALAIVPSSTVNAVGFQQLGKQGSWALVALSSRPLAAVYPSTFAAADAAAALVAVVPPPGQPGAAAAQLVVEGALALGASPTPRPRAEQSGEPDEHDEPGEPSEPDGQHAEHPHLAHEPVEVTAPLLGGAPPEPCSLVSWHPGEISLSCPALPVPGVAAVASAWAPGWQVSVDGVIATPLRVEALLRGVALPATAAAGTASSGAGPAATSSHAILWRYRPPAWPLASLLSALGVAALAGLALLPWAASLRAIVRRRR